MASSEARLQQKPSNPDLQCFHEMMYLVSAGQELSSSLLPLID